MIDGDGRAVCRVCLFAWGHYAAAILGGSVVHEAGGIRLRHTSHVAPVVGCALCRVERVRAGPSFDTWMRGQTT